MAGKDPSKTEQPTPKRLRDARTKGTVVISEEILSVVMVVGGLCVVVPAAGETAAVFQTLLHDLPRIDCTRTWTPADMVSGFQAAGALTAGLLLFPMLVMAGLAVASSWGQIGPYFELEPLRWKLDGLNPVTGMKKVLPTAENMVKLLFSMIKIAAIGFMTYLAIHRELEEMVRLPLLPLAWSADWIHHVALVLMLKICALFLLVAAADFAYRRYQHIQQLMMSRQEVRDETRESEGDPMVKGRLRRRMREISLSRLISEVPQADVVVVNPVHVAVALRYTVGTPAPRVVAKGLRKRAMRIRRMAEEAGVPVVEDKPLARALYRETRQGKYIPSRFYRAVASILANLQQKGLRRFA